MPKTNSGKLNPIMGTNEQTPSTDYLGSLLEEAKNYAEMEVAFVSMFDDGRQIFRQYDGPGDNFGIHLGSAIPVSASYCRRVLDGRVNPLLTDTNDERRVRNLGPKGLTGVRSYIMVPITFSDGRLYGSMACISSKPAPWLTDRDVRFLGMMARLAAEELERTEVEMSRWRTELDEILGILREHAFEMVYQPIFDLESGDTVGAEALARFDRAPAHTPDNQNPEAWFRQAASVGLGTALELAAIRTALEGLNKIPKNAYLSLNVSPDTLTTPGFTELMAKVPMDRIVIEITEHAKIQDYQALKDGVDALVASGARLAVDDAGAGFASLRHILRLSPQVIKLDLSLTHEVDADPVRRALTMALVQFALKSRATLTAEGIETQGEMNALRFMGVNYGQGFLLGRPASLPLAMSVPVAVSPN